MTPSQDNEVGKAFRQAFLDLLVSQGTDCEAGDATRRAIIQEDKQAGMYIFKFSDEFAAKKEDKIRAAKGVSNGLSCERKSGIFEQVIE